ncbi:hypothetical protein NDA01_30615, partial [Trichocoleus desertorum AS-A10]|uniref:hypothetical protein n=1 Tax=Trichocoleus desertorum TaxID=1481672 RepID=UPI00329DA43D
PEAADQKLQQQLQQSEGFDSYGGIQQWLKRECGVEVSNSSRNSSSLSSILILQTPTILFHPPAPIPSSLSVADKN